MILLPYYCFLGALDSLVCALPEVGPLSRPLLAKLRDVLPLTGAYPRRKNFHELHTRLLARCTVNDREWAVAACSLTLQGRWEIPELKKGDSRQERDEPTPSHSIDLKGFHEGKDRF
jgi:hypothetical protein